MLDGAADATPPLRDRAEYQDWVLTCSREYLRLKHDTEKGKNSFLNAYGANTTVRILPSGCPGMAARGKVKTNKLKINLIPDATPLTNKPRDVARFFSERLFQISNGQGM